NRHILIDRFRRCGLGFSTSRLRQEAPKDDQADSKYSRTERMPASNRIQASPTHRRCCLTFIFVRSRFSRLEATGSLPVTSALISPRRAQVSVIWFRHGEQDHHSRQYG